MTARNVVVAVKPDRCPRDHRACHSLREREDPARLAGHADVGFLPVRAGGLIDAADRSGVAAKQLRTPQQYPLQQRTQGKFTSQVLGDSDEAGRACCSPVGLRRDRMVKHLSSAARQRRAQPGWLSKPIRASLCGTQNVKIREITIERDGAGLIPGTPAGAV